MMLVQDADSEKGLEFSAYSLSASDWKTVVAVAQSLAEDATFDVDPDGLRFKGMDPSHIALVDIQMPRGSFVRFACSKPTKFTVHLEDFSKLVRRCDSKDPIEISKASNGALTIRTGIGNYKREFELHLLDSHSKPAPVPKLSFSTRFVIEADALGGIFNDASVVSTQIVVSSTGNSLTFLGKGDSGNARISLLKEDNDYLKEFVAAENSERCEASYSLEYLLKIMKAASTSADVINFQYSNKMPLKLEFQLGSNESGVNIQFYLAPRVTD